MIGRLLATEMASFRATLRVMSSRKGVGLIPARKSFLIRLALGPEGILWVDQAPKQSPLCPNDTKWHHFRFVSALVKILPILRLQEKYRSTRVFRIMRLIYYNGGDIHVYCRHFEAFSTTSQYMFSQVPRDLHRTFGTFSLTAGSNCMILTSTGIQIVMRWASSNPSTSKSSY
jgi:hypothetical protein